MVEPTTKTIASVLTDDFITVDCGPFILDPQDTIENISNQYIGRYASFKAYQRRPGLDIGDTFMVKGYLPLNDKIFIIIAKAMIKVIERKYMCYILEPLFWRT